MATPARTITTIEMSSQGGFVSGHQGAATARATAQFETTTAGLVHQVVGVSDSAQAFTLYDMTGSPAADLPATFIKLWFWADTDCHLQLITSATNVIIPIVALDPFVMATGQLLAAADTSKITDRTNAVTAIQQIVAGFAASGVNYRLILIL